MKSYIVLFISFVVVYPTKAQLDLFRDRAHQTLHRARSQYSNPRSCEATYYDLFKNNAPLERGDLLNKDIQSALKTMLTASPAQVRAAYTNVLQNNDNFKYANEIRTEWLKRIESTTISIRESFFPSWHREAPVSPEAMLVPGKAKTDQSKKIAVDLVGKSIFPKTYRKGEEPVMSIETGWFQGLDQATPIFWEAHEFSHLMQWTSPAIARCLQRSLDTRMIDIPFSNSTLSVKIREIRDGGFTEGLGTHLVPIFNAMVANGDTQEAELLISLLKKEKLLLSNDPQWEALKKAIERSSRKSRRNIATIISLLKLGLPEQITESAADNIATLVAVDYIKTNYKDPEQRRKAALDILRTFRPHLYSKESAHIMNQVGAKKDNETRALKIILANPEFRELVGCQFEGPTPRNCNEPIALGAPAVPSEAVR